jgi:hypothetical protein
MSTPPNCCKEAGDGKMLEGAVDGDIPGDIWPNTGFGEEFEGKEGVDP